MKLSLILSFILFSSFVLVDKSLSLTDYQIRKICEKAKRKSTCIKNLKEKRTNLQEGNLIEIPVIPYENKL